MSRKNKFNIPLAKAWFTDSEPDAARKVVKSGWLISGPKVEEFENKFANLIGVKYAVAVDTGSSAILVALAAIGIKSADEVIAPDMTFVSSASSCMYLGASPALVDINLDDYCIDYSKIAGKITKKTKAIIPVHYAGQAADMDKVMGIAKKHRVLVMEDAAEAHLSKFGSRYAGSIGDIGIFSFTPSKPMTTGEGGMIVTNNKKLAEKCRLIKNFSDTGKFKWDFLGFNFRMPEIMGAIGLEQLKKLERAVNLRREIAAFYIAGLAREDSIILPYVRSPLGHNFQLFTIRFKTEMLKASRDKIIGLLAAKGISSRLYYPSLHRQGIFRGLKLKDADFRNTLIFEKTALSLPIYPGIKRCELEYIVENIIEIVRNQRR